MKEKKSSQKSCKVDQIRKQCIDELTSADIGNPHLEFDLILACILKTTREKVITIDSIAEHNLELLKKLISKRAGHYPLQYITKSAHFYGHDFYIEPGCFIPRSETESLVEEAIELNPSTTLELCSGIGNITISMASKLKGKTFYCTDINLLALKILSKNVLRFSDELNRNHNHICLINASLFSAVKPTFEFDLAIVNPPYVDKSDSNVSEEVLFEPKEAVFAEERGLAIIEKILLEACHHMHNKSYLMIEIGYDQAEVVKKMSENLGYKLKKLIIDYSGIKRGVLLSAK